MTTSHRNLVVVILHFSVHHCPSLPFSHPYQLSRMYALSYYFGFLIGFKQWLFFFYYNICTVLQVCRLTKNKSEINNMNANIVKMVLKLRCYFCLPFSFPLQFYLCSYKRFFWWFCFISFLLLYSSLKCWMLSPLNSIRQC